ncbi:ChbG/HpnK family deacetylase [Methylocystis parvus]|uniref:ChbG/HpnK family deacetylase n=1 Tax=Methylocystis parvus TaxID=134 RepID=A0A6B8M2I6_9HYPH|nr:ChbG/HpnK family deacetylase [Methylocystis parvus]QGM99077.1 ChbG/HpnK family deacetylase [Methylocystis parvus]WBK00556.1 ChbG/HpnK family deacetylase [Methylocystis parvus OBBP]
MAKDRIIALCADDYGLSYGVSVGILKALDAGRLTAVSALVTGPRWPAMGRDLLRRSENADVGLHFNLTLGRPLGPMPAFAPAGTFPPVSKVIRAAMRGKLPMEEIRAEIDRQLDRFEAVMERRPDFVDGHQHVHGLPGVREALLDAMLARKLSGRAWVRNAADSVHRIAARRAHSRKALAVRALSSGFHRAANWRGFATNDGFSGFSDFDAGKDYAKSFESYLRAPGRAHLVMCHPGHIDDELKAQDPVTITREQELAFLLSPRLPEMLEKRGLRLARLSAALCK